MTFSPRAIEAALDKWYEKEDATDKGQQTAMRSAISAALAVDGLALVPRVPSEAMLEAGEQTFTSGYSGTPISTPADVWSAMIAAASVGHAPAPALQGWQPIETAPRDGSEIWAFNGEQARMKWFEADGTEEGYSLWIWADELSCDVDPSPEQPTHWQPLSQPPAASDREERRPPPKEKP
jgi:hypothetical protein